MILDVLGRKLLRPYQTEEKAMIKNAFLTAGVALALSSGVIYSGAAAADGLTLVSKNSPAPISVFCNNKKGLYDIPANGSLGPLPWGMISMMFGSSSMDCHFILDNGSKEEIGSAHMVLTATAGNITNATVKDKNYTVTADHSWGVDNKEMTVTLTKVS